MGSYKRLIKNKQFLRLLLQNQNKALINSATNAELICIYEIVQNFLQGNLSVNNCKLNKLRKFKKELRLLANKKISQKKKKKIINQTGGLLATLATTLIPIIVNLIMEKLIK